MADQNKRKTTKNTTVRQKINASEAEFSKTLDIDLEIQDLADQDQVLVLVSSEF
jgi:hypothetical protein